MSILDALSDQFDPGVIERGEEYFNAGRVSLIKAMNGKIVASVRGQRAYTVTIRGMDSDFNVGCTCPYWAENGLCKHLWATILKVDEEGLLPEDLEDFTGMTLDDSPQGPLPQIEREAISRQIERITRGKSEESKGPTWKRHLSELRRAMSHPSRQAPPQAAPLNGRRLIYVIEPDSAGYEGNELTISLNTQKQESSTRWGGPAWLRIRHSQIALLPDEQDRLIVQMLEGAKASYSYSDAPVEWEHTLGPSTFPFLLKRICDTGRCFVRADPDDDEVLSPVTWDEGPAWEFCLDFRLSPGEAFYLVVPMLVRGDERMDCQDAVLAIGDGGIIVTRSHVARLESFNAMRVFEAFQRYDEPLKIGRADMAQAMQELLSIHPLPRLNLPAELNIQRLSPPMLPRLKISAPKKDQYGDERLVGVLSYKYGEREILEGQEISPFDPQARTLLARDASAEAAAQAELDLLKFKHEYTYTGSGTQRRLAPAKLSKVVLGLCAKGWTVEAEGKLYRRAGEFKMEVSSGIDWFDLNGTMDFEGVSAALPKLLAAIKRGETTVQLDDGTMGILPEEWLRKYGLLARLAGKADEENVRFSRGQIGLLDALLTEMPQVTYDELFNQARQQIIRFEGIAPMDPAAGFTGTLRPYQRDGLGWLNFLNRFGLGGCLADDMGLGKTIQVLALLHARKAIGKPSLVVVPRSLIFNWIEEAKRFAPDLRVLDHSGVGRGKEFEHFENYDIILTTYGTLRLDAPLLKDHQFDYAVLDEAQAIKNGSSESAKAARLIRADHRLAMSGTPVQNHLGELWSLFEFLNPGMLGAASIFKVTGKGNGIEQEGREILARALRPFILRRTKEQVAKDLPEKTEQTIQCEMEPEQRKVYDELREHYRASLLNRIATEGIKKSKIQILEALLRLRQAACHPGLIDKSWIDKPAAKLDAMIPHIAEVIDEDHKVLVFSQFTSMLAIVKKHLDKKGIIYEYLDGQTKDRQARVNRFQTDPDCKVFLISLKAGGLGLNLTAAEYVFLLDPWWNPAIEAQAIDRAHRIGQTRRVFAYRFIANNTVEQKVLELQAKKKDLADMIINADNSLIGQLGKDDLELLLS